MRNIASPPALVFLALFASSLAHSDSGLSSEQLRRQLLTAGSTKANTADLFRRQNTTYPPDDVPGPTPQQAWTDAYNKAKAAGLIPSFAPSVLQNGNPVYTSGDTANVTGICSWTASKCDPQDDIINAPDGMSGITFDDGPDPPSSTLLPFLHQNDQKVTHFMIGSRIVDYPALFDQAVQVNQDHIGVHTWSHPYMTTLTDIQVVGELGWTMQIIYDRSGFVPAFWRPPYGDVDNRVRAIAKHVFGLTTVIWNNDSNDWCLTDDNGGQGSSCAVGTGPQTLQDLLTQLQGWYKGPKSPGLIILEHELYNRTVQGFIETFPLIKSEGWDARPIPSLWGLNWYQNAVNGSVKGTAVTGILPNPSASATAVNSALKANSTSSTYSHAAPSATSISGASSISFFGGFAAAVSFTVVLAAVSALM